MRLGPAIAIVILGAAAARADDTPTVRHPDPRAVTQAREANLEPESVREGFAIGLALGPSVQLGYGVGGATGGGGGFDLRLGTVASPRWVWLLELAATAYPHDNTANQSAVLTFGGQLYVRDAFWLRGGVGFASFTRRGDGSDGLRGLSSPPLEPPMIPSLGVEVTLRAMRSSDTAMKSS